VALRFTMDTSAGVCIETAEGGAARPQMAAAGPSGIGGRHVVVEVREALQVHVAFQLHFRRIVLSRADESRSAFSWTPEVYATLGGVKQARRPAWPDGDVGISCTWTVAPP